MNDKVRQRFVTADGFLRELADLDPDKVPRATIHSAYYAMFHAATGVVLMYGGKLTKTHSGLIARLSATLRVQHPHQLGLVSRLGRAFDERLVADYDDGSDVMAHARYLKTDARSYVAACRDLLGL